MMNFGSLATVQQTSTNNYLKPYKIYTGVTIDNVTIKEGTSTSGTDWKKIEITFKCEEGIYNESIFWISSDKDFERGESDMPNGGKRQLPSNWERTRDKMAAIGFAFAPEAFAKLQAAASKAKSFDDIANAFVKLIQAAIGKNPTNMKLVGRTSNGSIYASLPNCTGIAQAKDEKRAASNNVNVGDWYTWMISPFGNNLSFSAYEQKQADELANAKPTSMEPAEKNNIDKEEESDLDFESLL